MIELIIKTFYFMLPAYFANMAPVICKKFFKFLAVPIDFNKKLSGKPMFGKNKTYRGLIVAVVFAMIVAYVQSVLDLGINVYGYSDWYLFGFLMGSGAIIGDLVESFFKRRMGIDSGKPWIPFDQLDYTIGALLFVSFIFFPGLDVMITALVMNFFLHIIVNHAAFWLKIRNEKW